MKSLSEIAANRYLKKQKTSAYYCSVSLLQAYNEFEFRKDLSFSTFYSYVDAKYKKPHRISDLCDYCEKNKVYKRSFFKYYLQELSDISS